VKLVWDETAWDDYLWWQVQDGKTLRRINALIADIAWNGNDGIGKPEPLKHGFQGYWSRRITDEHRLVYKLQDDEGGSRSAAFITSVERPRKPRCDSTVHLARQECVSRLVWTASPFG
jgi:toxin YoeB